ncbi:MAG: nucleoside-triphosphatase [Bacteroidales bacterium]|nr:nucleoside-triphosphatase [Bacteroidales bacterium]
MVWLKAAVVGSLWASIEIILGSFLHNLRIPFSGSTLAFIAVWLIVAFARVWKEPGLIWRAGLIAALMKSISPSAVILGPMIGIFTEALVMELSIRLIGRNLAGFIIGGGLAVLSALMHKAVNLLVLYGFDLVKVLDALFRFSAHTLRIDNIGLKEAFFILAAIYIAAGICAAIFGYFSGGLGLKRLKESKLGDSELQEPLIKPDLSKKSSELFAHTSVQKYATPLLFANLSAIITALFLMGSGRLIWAALFSAIYLGFCFYRYKRAVLRLKRFSFWIPFMLITLIAAMLLEGIDKGFGFSMEGLMIGIRMNLRAFVILTGFTAISTEMKNPAIKMILYNKGFAKLYQALNLSFSALPGVLAFVSEKRKQKGMRILAFPYILMAAEHLLLAFKKENARKAPVIIITGDIGQGKTTYATKLANMLREEHIPVTGFLAPGKMINNEKTGFMLLSLEDNSLTPLSSKTPNDEWQHVGSYYFNPEGLAKGKAILQPENTNAYDVLLIDEVGPLELNDFGWASGIERALGEPIIHCWIVRRSLVQKAARKWDVGTVYVYDISEDSADAIVRQLKHLTERPGS